ncbi:8009_t:CDS:2 [Ambispora gerdemannii]|uniref:8009_t:CDS:1 n=1 Tax=Ambispora gerdemannii TaxID=144530 RepID=A0A9N9CQN6_9GLOM|nr:8009_t:CDS:2 [Ambispora gerdemannii]
MQLFYIFELDEPKEANSLQQVGINYAIVSRMASAAWKRQPEYKKSKYESLSKAANLQWAKWDPKPN